MIYVTHDQVEAMTLADRIVVLSAVALSRSARRWSFASIRSICSWRIHRISAHEFHRREW